MAFVNGKKVYNSQRLAAAAKLEDRSVSEYTFLLCGTGDDWGRFEANPRVIVGNAYKNRPDVAEADVARWLQIYEQVRGADEGDYGLVRFYVVDGVRYGEWTSYAGDAESQRKYHNCPEPPWSTHKHRGTCERYGAAKDKPPAPSSSIQVPAPGTRKPYPDRAPVADRPNIYPTESAVSAVPTGSPETDSAAAARASEAVPLATDEPGKALTPQERLDLETEGNTLIRHIHGTTGEDQREIIGRASIGDGKWGGGRKFTWASMSDERLLNTVMDLRAWWERVRPHEDSTVAIADPPYQEPAAVAPWDGVVGELKPRLSPHAWATWIRPLVPYTFDGQLLRVHTPTDVIARWIKANFVNQVREAAAAAGLHGVQIEFACFRDRPPPALTERKEPTRVPGGRTQMPAESGRGG